MSVAYNLSSVDTWEGYPEQPGLVWRGELLPGGALPERFKICQCCGNEYDLGCWKAAPLVGVQHMAGDVLELRNCSCGSTMAVATVLFEES